MSDIVIVALIASIAPTIVAIGGIILSLLNRQQISYYHGENTQKLQELHIDINSRLDQLVAAKELIAKAEGVEIGKTYLLIPPTEVEKK